MKKLYVVRGLGEWAEDIWVSSDFEVTMLHQEYDHSRNWKSEAGKQDFLCYEGFTRVTGIELKPGEYTTISIEPR